MAELQKNFEIEQTSRNSTSTRDFKGDNSGSLKTVAEGNGVKSKEIYSDDDPKAKTYKPTRSGSWGVFERSMIL